MSHAGAENSHGHSHPKAIVKTMRWPYPLVWLVPIAAIVIAGFYFGDTLARRGPEITITFPNADGLKPAETKIMHLGVEIGVVTAIDIAPDQKGVLIKARLQRGRDVYAQKGARFWVVRPEISVQSISGLGTVLSGPFIDSSPGSGELQTEFTALEKAPVQSPDGLRITLMATRAQHLSSGTPIFYKDVQVGIIEDVRLSFDASGVAINAVIRRPYSPLVRNNSQFWIVSGVDVKGGLLSGIQMKMESLKSLLSGGVSFATPEKDMGDQVQDGADFILHDEPGKDWEKWSPKIAIRPDETEPPESRASLPMAPQPIRTSVR